MMLKNTRFTYMKKYLLIILLNIFLINISSTFSQSPSKLSANAEISLLTCSPGGEIYSLFGHSAIRVKDPVSRIDLVFNYGIFDFETPNFVMKFVRGKLLYKLGVERFRRFQYQYVQENRQVIEQVFNLDALQKQKVYDFLTNNALPENAEYKYDFFFDNCASRIDDVLRASLGEEFTYDIPKREYLSFRNQLDYYIDGSYPKSPWADFGMDLILGIPADQTADFKGEMFLPDLLSNNFTFGKLNNKTPLVKASKIIIPRKKPASIANWTVTPLLLFWVLCGITALFFLRKNNTFTKIFDFVLFLLLGLSGALFIFMWVATDHSVCHQNLNMLWMNPFHLLLAVNILRNNLNGFWKKYLWATLIINGLIIIFWKLLPQEFHWASFPIILMISMRVVALLKQDDILNVKRRLSK